MTQAEKDIILGKFRELLEVCGDLLGRDGEYIDIKVSEIQHLIEDTKTNEN